MLIGINLMIIIKGNGSDLGLHSGQGTMFEQAQTAII